MGPPRAKTTRAVNAGASIIYLSYSFSGDLRYPCRRPLLELDIVELGNYSISLFLDLLKKTRFDSQKPGFRVECLQKLRKCSFWFGPTFTPLLPPLLLDAARVCYVLKKLWFFRS